MKTNADRIHRKWMRKRRFSALFAVLRLSETKQYWYDYGIIAWIGATIKAIICLLLNRVVSLEHGSGKDVLAIYGAEYWVDHFDWMSVWVNSDWREPWNVSIEHDGE